jgi:predicted Zn-ribbon and HTH transcriptional regulator
MNNSTESLALEQRYVDNHARILRLKEEIGKSFWSLGHQLMRMQRECIDCGAVPLHAEFEGNNKKSHCPGCGASELGLFRHEHKTFNAYLQHVKIHRQTAYRKIGIYETFHQLLPIIGKLAPVSDHVEHSAANHSQSDIDEHAQAWAQEYLVNIGWTVLEAIQARVTGENDESKILKIIQEAETTPREYLGKNTICSALPHKAELDELRSRLNSIQKSLQRNQVEQAGQHSLELSQCAHDFAEVLQVEQVVDVEFNDVLEKSSS